METVDQKIVLLLPRHATSWAKLHELAVAMTGAAALKPIILLANDDVADRARSIREGVEYLDVRLIVNRSIDANIRVWVAMMARVEGFLETHPIVGNVWPIAFLRMKAMHRKLAAEYLAFHDIIANIRPIALLLPGDRELSPVPAAIKAANELNVTTIIAVSALPNPDALQFSRRLGNAFRIELKYFAPLLNLYVAWRFPGQVHEGPEGRTLFSPGWRTMALHLAGMLSPRPWIEGGGLCQYVFEISKSRAEIATRLGRPASKSILIGDQTLDPVYRAYRTREEMKACMLGDDLEKPLVVFSMPNDAEHGVCGYPEHLKRMESYLEAISEHDVKVIISLHPKSSRKTYDALVEKYGFDISEGPLSLILPAADLFITGASSTIYWARLTAVRTIVLDYLQYRSDHFKSPVGLDTIESVSEFRNRLSGALSSALDPTDIAVRRKYADELAEQECFDGQSTARILAFLSDLASKNSATKATAGC